MTTIAPETIYAEAAAAGIKAGSEVGVTPMIVGESTTPFGNTIDYSKPVYYVSEGVCGFGWVNIKPARGKFVAFLKQSGIGRTDTYEGGYTVPVYEFNQSYERKVAYARAFAAVLNKYGIKAYASGRLD